MEYNNSILNPLMEDTTGPADPNVATTDSNLSVDAMYQQALLPSLGRQIFSVIPIQGPTGALFNVRRKSGTNDFELVRANVEVYSSESIKTGITQEVVQDVLSQYGTYGNVIIGRLLRDLANEQENARTLAFLETNSLAEDDLQLSDSLVSETNLFEIGQRVNELIMKANDVHMRTFEAFCVLPYYAAGTISALRQYANSGEDDKDERGLFVGQIGQVKYFLNPDITSTMAYVGLKDLRNPSKSSAVFSPYASSVITATDPDTGALTYHLFNRFAITASPLHVSGDEMLFKFNIFV